MLLACALGVDTANHLRAVGDGLLRVESALCRAIAKSAEKSDNATMQRPRSDSMPQIS